ncbi:MAG: hypothetical protein ACE5JQ_09255 [Candidatus Methylomirabilales bacterium]
MIGTIYTMVVTTILLFPWLILGVMMAGALRDRWKGRPEYARACSRTPVRWR